MKPESPYSVMSKFDKDALKYLSPEYLEAFTGDQSSNGWYIVDFIYVGRWRTEYDPLTSIPGAEFWDNGTLYEKYYEFMHALLLPGGWK